MSTYNYNDVEPCDFNKLMMIPSDLFGLYPLSYRLIVGIILVSAFAVLHPTNVQGQSKPVEKGVIKDFSDELMTRSYREKSNLEFPIASKAYTEFFLMLKEGFASTDEGYFRLTSTLDFDIFLDGKLIGKSESGAFAIESSKRGLISILFSKPLQSAYIKVELINSVKSSSAPFNGFATTASVEDVGNIYVKVILYLYLFILLILTMLYSYGRGGQGYFYFLRDAMLGRSEELYQSRPRAFTVLMLLAVIPVLTMIGFDPIWAIKMTSEALSIQALTPLIILYALMISKVILGYVSAIILTGGGYERHFTVYHVFLEASITGYFIFILCPIAFIKLSSPDFDTTPFHLATPYFYLVSSAVAGVWLVANVRKESYVRFFYLCATELLPSLAFYKIFVD